jgi:hypothetical protein
LRGARDRARVLVPCSPRQALLAVRKELQAAMKTDRRESYRERLARCARERRKRTSPKQKRVWPQRTPHNSFSAHLGLNNFDLSGRLG